MLKTRIRFIKQGRARFISHLDLMGVFQRAFVRAKLPVKYTEGFNPHIYISIAMPMPTGYEGECEIADTELTIAQLPRDFIQRLNAVLPEGLLATDVYLCGGDAKNIAFVQYHATVLGECLPKREECYENLSVRPVMLTKRSKNGERTVDLWDSLHSCFIDDISGGYALNLIMMAGEGKLNPEYAVNYLFGVRGERLYRRVGVLDSELCSFR